MTTARELSAEQGRRDRELLLRRGLLVVAAVAALTGVLAGLARLGIGIAWGPSRALEHGPLLVAGLFGTVIALERAVALSRPWGYAAPAAGAAAAMAMQFGLGWAPWAAAASAGALLAVNAAIVMRQAAAFTYLMLAGSAVLLLGNVAWTLGQPVFAVVPAWIGFFVLTIVGERLELSRLAPTPRWASRTLVVLAIVFALLAVALVLDIGSVARPFGASMALLAAWQLRFDLAGRLLRQPGLPRYSASGVMLGALWLLVAGVLVATTGLPPAGLLRDAALHSVFVGYVLSMVFAHAPIILPAVARIRLPFHRALYVPLLGLHASLVLRVAGDLMAMASLREAGAVGNALSLAAFAAAVFYARAARNRGQGQIF